MTNTVNAYQLEVFDQEDNLIFGPHNISRFVTNWRHNVYYLNNEARVTIGNDQNFGYLDITISNFPESRRHEIEALFQMPWEHKLIVKNIGFENSETLALNNFAIMSQINTYFDRNNNPGFVTVNISWVLRNYFSANPNQSQTRTHLVGIDWGRFENINRRNQNSKLKVDWRKCGF